MISKYFLIPIYLCAITLVCLQVTKFIGHFEFIPNCSYTFLIMVILISFFGTLFSCNSNDSDDILNLLIGYSCLAFYLTLSVASFVLSNNWSIFFGVFFFGLGALYTSYIFLKAFLKIYFGNET
jgi:hypothetical protein